MIKGIVKTPLKQIKDERGKVMHMLRATDPHFEQFGEVYFSWIYKDIIKAWHKHLKIKINYAVPVGQIKVVLYDDRAESPTFGELNQFHMDDEDYYLLTIPVGIWYGFMAIGNQSAMVVNCATLPYEQKEAITINHDDPRIPYQWGKNSD